MPSDDANTAKKRSNVEEDDDDMSIGAMLSQKKKSNANSGSKPSLKDLKVKKEPSPDSDSKDVVKVKKEPSQDFDKNVKARSKVSKVKSEVKHEEVDIKPILRKLSATKPKTKNSSGAEKKRPVYELPGQKREPPEERDPSRVFYETLLEQNPHSEMAQIWMMEHGLLPKELAAEIFERQKKKKNLSSPGKAIKKQTVSPAVKKTTPTSASAKSLDKKKSTPASKSAETAKPTKKRKKSDESEEDSDDDFIIRTAKKKK